MKQNISKVTILKIAMLIVGVVSVFSVIAITIVSQLFPQVSNIVTKPANAYHFVDLGGYTHAIGEGWVYIDAADGHNDCVDQLGGTFSAGTCTVTSPVTITDKPLMLTHGTTLIGGGNVTIDFATGSPFASISGAGVFLMGGSGVESWGSTDAVVLDEIIVQGHDNIDWGVHIEGHNITLSNTVVTGGTMGGIQVSRNAESFTLDTNTTSDGVVGVSVRPHAPAADTIGGTGTITNHTANSNSSHGIELIGTKDITITNSDLIGNGGYGLYVRDTTWSVEYSGGLFTPDSTVTSTSAFVDGNTMTGNTTADVAVDVTDASPWDAAQSASAVNTYVTLSEINGTFPGAKASPPAPVPEFHEYVLMVTLALALGFMFKRIPQINSGMRAA